MTFSKVPKARNDEADGGKSPITSQKYVAFKYEQKRVLYIKDTLLLM